MSLIEQIPTSFFETAGVLAGLLACMTIVVQILKEYRSNAPSSLALSNVLGWILIYLFWGLYGVRFNAIALWLTNGIALLLQLYLSFVLYQKRATYKEA